MVAADLLVAQNVAFGIISLMMIVGALRIVACCRLVRCSGAVLIAVG